jgi:hypothetical protein
VIRLSYQDASDLAELVSHMESATLPTGHTASMEMRDKSGAHYATIEVGSGGEAVLTLAQVSLGSGIQDTPR